MNVEYFSKHLQNGESSIVSSSKPRQVPLINCSNTTATATALVNHSSQATADKSHSVMIIEPSHSSSSSSSSSTTATTVTTPRSKIECTRIVYEEGLSIDPTGWAGVDESDKTILTNCCVKAVSMHESSGDHPSETLVKRVGDTYHVYVFGFSRMIETKELLTLQSIHPQIINTGYAPRVMGTVRTSTAGLNDIGAVLIIVKTTAAYERETSRFVTDEDEIGGNRKRRYVQVVDDQYVLCHDGTRQELGRSSTDAAPPSYQNTAPVPYGQQVRANVPARNDASSSCVVN